MVKYQKAKKKPVGKVKIALIVAGVVVGIELLVQIVWPNTILTPNTIIDEENYGLWDKTRVISMLDTVYKGLPVGIFFGDNTESYLDTTMGDIGMSVSNTKRITQIDYPAYWRLVPTSLFWYGLTSQVGPPQVIVDEITSSSFIDQNFGNKNYIKPVDAGLIITDEGISLKKSQIGGTYSLSELKNALKKPVFSNKEAIVSVDIVAEYPKVDDEAALKVATTVSGQLINDLILTFDDYDDEVKLSVATLRGWITFEVIDGKLTPVINEKKLNKFLESEVAPLIEKAAGTTTITTNDLAGLDRQEGDEGKVLNTVETALRITEYLLGKRQSVVVAVESIDPSVEYVYERITDDTPVEEVDDDEELEPESFI